MIFINGNFLLCYYICHQVIISELNIFVISTCMLYANIAQKSYLATKKPILLRLCYICIQHICANKQKYLIQKQYLGDKCSATKDKNTRFVPFFIQ